MIEKLLRNDGLLCTTFILLLPFSFSFIVVNSNEHVVNRNDYVVNGNGHVVNSNDHVVNSNDHVVNSNDYVVNSNGRERAILYSSSSIWHLVTDSPIPCHVIIYRVFANLHTA